MKTDSVNEEIRVVRRKLASRFNNDLALILADIRRQELASGRQHVSLPPRPVAAAVDQPANSSVPLAMSGSGGESPAAG